MKPASLHILYEDNDIIVCIKPHGLATQSKKPGIPDLERMILNHIAKAAQTAKKSDGNVSVRTAARPYLAVIHRLDQPVAGILVFAKTPDAARELNKQLQKSGFGKHYYALVEGNPEKEAAILENYMVKDGRTNTSRICDRLTPDAKPARLSYRIVDDVTFPDFVSPHSSGSTISQTSESLDTDPDTVSHPHTLLEVILDTGRHHQIRVQLANMGCPIVGDSKYNPASQDRAPGSARHNEKNSVYTDSSTHKFKNKLCLCAYKLTFTHPRTKKPMTFLYPHSL